MIVSCCILSGDLVRESFSARAFYFFSYFLRGEWQEVCHFFAMFFSCWWSKYLLFSLYFIVYYEDKKLQKKKTTILAVFRRYIKSDCYDWCWQCYWSMQSVSRWLAVQQSPVFQMSRCWKKGSVLLLSLSQVSEVLSHHLMKKKRQQ